ncbi:MAG: glycosyltransferase family 4 protein [Candidatus Aminicenantes bacterium]|nr:glycosyltransferase family 4 protein [Candidatus Aminicenantes bacterium]
MLAPEPFFQPRGTPISVYFRLKALADLGHRTDLLTYPLGEDVALGGLTIRRVPNAIGIRRVKIGPSLAKIPLDAMLFLKAFAALLRRRYDLIFSHEEAAFIGLVLGRLFRVPHLYDMHSSLPQQLRNFDFSRSPLLHRLFVVLERAVLRGSKSVIVICRDLLDTVAGQGFGEKAVFLENFIDFSDFEDGGFSEAEVAAAKHSVAPRGEKVVLYAGNYEPYQGVPLLVEAFARAGEGAVLLLVGGSKADQEPVRKRAAELGIAGRLALVEKVPPRRVPLFIALADVLVSPRVSGTNTPLKIYSFLKSGKPFVATNLWTHTQVLDERVAVLADPEPEALGRAIAFALASDEARDRARAAADLADREYVYPRYLEKMAAALRRATG